MSSCSTGHSTLPGASTSHGRWSHCSAETLRSCHKMWPRRTDTTLWQSEERAQPILHALRTTHRARQTAPRDTLEGR